MKAAGKVLDMAAAVVFLLYTPVSAVLAAQEPEPSPARVVRVGLDLGGGTIGDAAVGIGARFGVTLPREWGVVTIRGASVTEFNLFGPSPAESVSDLGLLYGRELRGKWGYATASAGLAYVAGVRRGSRTSPPSSCYDIFGCIGAMFETVEHEALPFHTVGIPLDLEVGLTFSRVLGFNAGVWANVNGERTMTGASLGLVLGQLR